jgi:hypothetical protein
MSDSKLRVLGLTRVEALDARASVAGLTTEPIGNASSASHGEPVSLAVVLGIGAISAFSAWLLKNRTTKHLQLAVEVVRRDKIQRVKLDYQIDESLTTEQTIEGLAKVLERMVTVTGETDG